MRQSEFRIRALWHLDLAKEGKDRGDKQAVTRNRQAVIDNIRAHGMKPEKIEHTISMIDAWLAV